VKVRQDKLTKRQIIETLDALYTAAGTVRGRDAMKLFLRDLLTKSERIMLGRRILIAQRLVAGETYDAIQSELGAGPGTIAGVERWLQDQVPGYEKAIQGMEDEYIRRRGPQRDTDTREYFKKRFPLFAYLFKSR
jgi:uncharacterized protein YerC